MNLRQQLEAVAANHLHRDGWFLTGIMPSDQRVRTNCSCGHHARRGTYDEHLRQVVLLLLAGSYHEQITRPDGSKGCICGHWPVFLVPDVTYEAHVVANR